MERLNPNINEGLNDKQVEKRKQQGLINTDISVPTKSIKKIILSNLFTLFNFLNIFLAVLVFLVGSYKNTLFLGVVFCNVLISTIQEIRSKKIIDKLNVITQKKVNVIRNSKIESIDFDELVLDDIYILKQGSQVVTDSIIQEGYIEVDESFISGESNLISYSKGDFIKSGSFVVVGNCKVKVEHISSDNYINVISKDAKYINEVNSILLKSLKKIIKIISYCIIPMGILLFLNQYDINQNIQDSVVNTVAALIGMIPEGLILLTSTVLAVSIVRLSKINVLAQDLYSIEMLARVDTICLDKTGTITDGQMEVIEIVKLKDYDIEKIMGNIVNHMDINNATSIALNNYFKKYDNYSLIETIPFSPNTKYSGSKFKEGIFIIGAKEFICDEQIKEMDKYKNKRVLVLCKKEDRNIPLALIILKDTIRKNIVNTLNYLKEQQVDIKIVSGDGIDMVKSIAKEVGLNNLNAIDISKIDDEQLEKEVLKNNIFVRSNPLQKKKIIEILQKNGHFVAMAGDGVNDVLALKQSDCGITIKSGTEMAKNVSEIVILDDDFNSIPTIIKEGRRSINNLQRSTSLFLDKTIYSFLLALIFMIFNSSYPFEPIQLTLTSVFTIGIPSFILALEPNDKKISGNFMGNVIRISLPAALTIVLNIIILSIFSFNLESGQVSTLCVIMTGFTGFLLLFRICMPFNKLRICLITSLIIGFIVCIVGLRNLFSLTILNLKMFIFIAILVIISTCIFNLLNYIVDKILVRRKL